MPFFAILPIDHDALQNICKPVTNFDANLAKIGKKMQKTMAQTHGCGLAANQVGIDARIIAIDAINLNGKRFKSVLINPMIIYQSIEMQNESEGCLSMPNYDLIVPRAKLIKISYQNLNGQFQELEADGNLAIALQHEIDHLNGITFLDRVSKLKRERAKSYFSKSMKR